MSESLKLLFARSIREARMSHLRQREEKAQDDKLRTSEPRMAQSRESDARDGQSGTASLRPILKPVSRQPVKEFSATPGIAEDELNSNSIEATIEPITKIIAPDNKAGEQDEKYVATVLKPNSPEIIHTSDNLKLTGNDLLPSELKLFPDGFHCLPYFGKLPGQNPFWATNSAKAMKERLYCANHEKNQGSHKLHRNTLLLGRENPNEDKIQTLVSKVVYLYHLRLSPAVIHNHILSPRLKEEPDTLAYKVMQKRMNNNAQFYRQILVSFVKPGILELDRVMTTCGTPLAGTEHAQRMQLYICYWNQDPYANARLMLDRLACAVDLHGIYHSRPHQDDNDVYAWRKYIRGIFAYLCEIVFEEYCPQEFLKAKRTDHQKALEVGRRLKVLAPVLRKKYEVGNLETVPCHAQLTELMEQGRN